MNKPIKSFCVDQGNGFSALPLTFDNLSHAPLIQKVKDVKSYERIKLCSYWNMKPMNANVIGIAVQCTNEQIHH